MMDNVKKDKIRDEALANNPELKKAWEKRKSDWVVPFTPEDTEKKRKLVSPFQERFDHTRWYLIKYRVKHKILSTLRKRLREGAKKRHYKLPVKVRRGDYWVGSTEKQRERYDKLGVKLFNMRTDYMGWVTLQGNWEKNKGVLPWETRPKEVK